MPLRHRNKKSLKKAKPTKCKSDTKNSRLVRKLDQQSIIPNTSQVIKVLKKIF